MSAAPTSFGLAFQPLFDRVLAQLDEAARPVLRRCAVRSRLGPQRDAAQQEHISKKLKVAPTLAGDKYLGQIREILASKLGLKRSGTQIKFHESFLQAISRILYRSDGAQADMSAIMEREKWSDLQQQVCCLTPRRFGTCLLAPVLILNAQLTPFLLVCWQVKQRRLPCLPLRSP